MFNGSDIGEADRVGQGGGGGVLRALGSTHASRPDSEG